MGMEDAFHRGSPSHVCICLQISFIFFSISPSLFTHSCENIRPELPIRLEFICWDPTLDSKRMQPWSIVSVPIALAWLNDVGTDSSWVTCLRFSVRVRGSEKHHDTLLH